MKPDRLGIGFVLAAAAVMFQIACPIAIASEGSHLASGPFASRSDAARYRQIAETPGTPYRDFQVEYPPVAVGLFHAIGPRDFGGFRERLFALQVACQALIVLLLFRLWGKRAGWSYVILSAPMLFVVYNDFDLVAVALAVAAYALIRRGHALGGAAGLVVGAFTKVWPVALLPVLLVRRNGRALALGAAAGVAGLVAWSVWGGSGAVLQVLDYRGAHGWEYESVPGSLLRLFTHDSLHVEKGAIRVGAPPHAATVLLTVLVVLAVAGIWGLALRRPSLPEGLAEVAVIASLLLLGTLLSPQYLIWPLPFVAIAAGAGVKRLEPWAAAAVFLTLLDWTFFFDPVKAGFARGETVVIARNLALAGLLVVAVVEIRRNGGTRTPDAERVSATEG